MSVNPRPQFGAYQVEVLRYHHDFNPVSYPFPNGFTRGVHEILHQKYRYYRYLYHLPNHSTNNPIFTVDCCRPNSAIATIHYQRYLQPTSDTNKLGCCREHHTTHRCHHLFQLKFHSMKMLYIAVVISTVVVVVCVSSWLRLLLSPDA